MERGATVGAVMKNVCTVYEEILDDYVIWDGTSDGIVKKRGRTSESDVDFCLVAGEEFEGGKVGVKDSDSNGRETFFVSQIQVSLVIKYQLQDIQLQGV